MCFISYTLIEGVELPFRGKKCTKIYLKINWSVKTSRHKPSVIATCSGLWAPLPDFFDLGQVHTWRLYFALKSTSF